jgi:hypothetical protein
MKYCIAGESHGSALSAIIEGVPAGLGISEQHINADLERRQGGYGRGARQKIEKDQARITAGVRFGKTMGSPVCMIIENKDAIHHVDDMAVFGKPPLDIKKHVVPRPGHADLAGVLKFNAADCSDIAEQASARNTAAVVAAASIAREFLSEMGVEVFSYVNAIGTQGMQEDNFLLDAPDYKPLDIEMSELRCPSPEATQRMKDEIDAAREHKDSLGGTFRVIVRGLVPGLGGTGCSDNRLTAQLGSAIFGIPALRSLDFGLGRASASLPGSRVHDPITRSHATGEWEFTRTSNNAGGLEGGLTTGMPLILTCAMKPIPTLMQPLASVNLETLEADEACVIRSDVCAVPAAAIVAESRVAFVLANAYIQKFGGDCMIDCKAALEHYRARLRTMAR